ncbi:hypothetical protein HDV05_001432, partial [Chytridiales sp. JEL 0842]
MSSTQSTSLLGGIPENFFSFVKQVPSLNLYQDNRESGHFDKGTVIEIEASWKAVHSFWVQYGDQFKQSWRDLSKGDKRTLLKHLMPLSEEDVMEISNNEVLRSRAPLWTEDEKNLTIGQLMNIGSID